MIQKKLNVKKLGAFCIVVLVVLVTLIIFISKLVKEAKISQTDEYKLSEVGYTDNEIKAILKCLDKDSVQDIISQKYKKDLTKFIKEDYFIYDNLERYLSYYEENSDFEASKIIAIVNVNADSNWYSNIIDTDTSRGNLMLVNKFYKLAEGYEPEDLMELPGTYAYQGNYVSSSIYDDLSNMLDAAEEKGYTLVVSQGYRSYTEQEETYNSYKDMYGESDADDIAARPGHSEYQTGLSVLIVPIYQNEEEIDITKSPEYAWLSENAYKYGFILRYPQNKSDITGFNSDNWRYRYVGREVAKAIHDSNITFDEYYAFNLNK